VTNQLARIVLKKINTPIISNGDNDFVFNLVNLIRTGIYKGDVNESIVNTVDRLYKMTSNSNLIPLVSDDMMMDIIYSTDPVSNLEIITNRVVKSRNLKMMKSYVKMYKHELAHVYMDTLDLDSGCSEAYMERILIDRLKRNVM